MKFLAKHTVPSCHIYVISISHNFKSKKPVHLSILYSLQLLFIYLFYIIFNLEKYINFLIVICMYSFNPHTFHIP